MTIVRDVITQARRLECENSFEYHCSYFFKQRAGLKMIKGRHHDVIFRFINDVINGKIQRGIINVPPGYTKTEIATIALIAYGLSINKRAKFLHLSYSKSLALNNSAEARRTVMSPDFFEMWQMSARDDANAKETWWNEFGGGVRATSSLGQVTGFRAGTADHAEDNFTGALIIDDPLKPEDADYALKLDSVNFNYNNTIASRVMIETVPILVIMQRVHNYDLSGYLLRGGSGEKWHHLNLPVIIDNSKKYPEKYTHGIPYAHNLEDGWLWPWKHNEEHRAKLMSNRKVWRAQYLQDPIERDENLQLWTDPLIENAKNIEFSNPTKTVVSVDPAVSNNSSSDEHGIIVASKYLKNQYSVDADYTRKGSPLEWANAAIRAYELHDADEIVIEINQGGDMCEQTLRNAGFTGRIKKVHATKGKVLRAEPIAALYELSHVAHKKNLTTVEDEMLDFDRLSGKSNGKSPNRVDAVVWALTELAGLDSNVGVISRRARRR